MWEAMKAQGPCQLGLQCASAESGISLMVYAPLCQLLRRGEKVLEMSILAQESVKGAG